MVGRAPEGEDPEVTLEVVAPKKVPAAVGGGATEESEGNDAEQPEEPCTAARGGRRGVLTY
jgi:hypothetical protein